MRKRPTGGTRSEGGADRDLTRESRYARPPRRAQSSPGARPLPSPAAAPRALGRTSFPSPAAVPPPRVRDALPDRRPAPGPRRRRPPRRLRRPDDPDGQQLVPPSRSARAAPASTTTRARGGLRVAQPELEGAAAAGLGGETGADLLAGQARARRRGQPLADDGRDAGRGRHLGGDDLRAHAAGAEHRRRAADVEALERAEVRRPSHEPGVGVRRGSAVNSPSVEVSMNSSSRRSASATWAARKSLSPKEISSVVVVSFSLITGTTATPQLRSVWRALR